MTNRLTIAPSRERREPSCTFCGKDRPSIPVCNDCIQLYNEILDGVTKGQPLERLRQWCRKTQLSFDNFIAGSSNRAAYDAAKAAVAAPGQRSNNPLVIYGGIGSGKTHLLQAIANQFVSNRPQAKVSYLHCERFVMDVVRAYQNHRFDEFMDWYGNLDLLLIDDLHFNSWKIKCQDELILIVETLLESDKQVVFSRFQPPLDVSDLHPKLVSLLQAGNVIAIAPPEARSA